MQQKIKGDCGFPIVAGVGCLPQDRNLLPRQVAKQLAPYLAALFDGQRFNQWADSSPILQGQDGLEQFEDKGQPRRILGANGLNTGLDWRRRIRKHLEFEQRQEALIELVGEMVVKQAGIVFERKEPQFLVYHVRPGGQACPASSAASPATWLGIGCCLETVSSASTVSW